MDNRDHLWRPGQSGNPNGRPRGSRNKRTQEIQEHLTEFFSGRLQDLERMYGEGNDEMKLRIWKDFSPYVLPRLHATQAEISLEKMSPSEIDALLSKLIPDDE
jgi:hypothetical protein